MGSTIAHLTWGGIGMKRNWSSLGVGQRWSTQLILSLDSMALKDYQVWTSDKLDFCAKTRRQLIVSWMPSLIHGVYLCRWVWKVWHGQVTLALEFLTFKLAASSYLFRRFSGRNCSYFQNEEPCCGAYLDACWSCVCEGLGGERAWGMGRTPWRLKVDQNDPTLDVGPKYFKR